MSEISGKATQVPIVLRLFGVFELEIEGRSVAQELPRKDRWLLALLALAGERPVQRTWLAQNLWPFPETLESQAATYLRKSLWNLRNTLGEHAGCLLLPTLHTLALDLQLVEVDVVAFDRAIARMDQASLLSAIARYAGPLLPECTEIWALTERETRHQAYLKALEHLANGALEIDDPTSAVNFLRRATAADPLRESAHRDLMQALARCGDFAAAEQVYQQFVRRLQREDSSLLPAPETAALYQGIRRKARQRVAVPAAPPTVEPSPLSPHGYLPRPLTELVGRDAQAEEVASRIRRSRLVTLTGTGGIGKTRLALAAAEIVRIEFIHGVWFVDLSALQDPDRIVQAISGVLKLRAKPGSDLRAMLTDYLADRKILLLLDNCEQLLEGCAELAESLLEACGDLKILVTSRHPLGVAGEVDWRVPSLETPDPEHLPSGGAELVAAVRRHAAAELFVERAKAAQQTFALTRENAADVARICLRLDGIPLALQLAATRIKALTAKQIAERMDDGFHLLTGGSRTIPRHQTLQATMDWSFQLLSEQERALLSRVSVFAGGWTLEAAEQVCSDLRGSAQACSADNRPSRFDPRQGILAKEAVLDLLAGLVEKSLVLWDESREEARYRLLGTIRQYSAEKLRESGQELAVRTQHRNYFVQLAESAELHLRGPEQQWWLDRLEAEQENLIAALEFAFSVPPASDRADTSEHLSGARLAAALGWYCHTRGTAIEGLRWMEKALETCGGASSIQRIRLLQRAGLLAMDQGEPERAYAYLEESLERARTLNDPPGIASALLGLGNVAREQGDYEAARSLLQQSLSLFRELGDTGGAGQVLQSLAGIAANQNDYPTARRFAEEGLAIYRRLQDRQSMAVVLGNLGILARLEGDYPGAQTLYQESLELYRECKDRAGMARILGNLGNLAEDQCDSTAAYSLHQESLSLQRALGDKQGAAISLYNLGVAAQELSDFEQAAALYRESLTLCRGLRDRLGVAYALQKLATTLAERDRPLRGISLFAAAERLRELLKAPIPPQQLPGHEIGLADIRATVGETAFSAAWKVGASLDWEQAVAFALEEEEMGDENPADGLSTERRLNST